MALSVDNSVLQSFMFYAAILVIKIMAMAVLTALQRFKHKAFVNPEDFSKLKLKQKTDDNVERVRRAHLNDLENVTLFFVIGFIYCLTDPSPILAKLLFLVYTVARIVYSFVYAVYVIPGARGIPFVTGMIINTYMAIASICYFF